MRLVGLRKDAFVVAGILAFSLWYIHPKYYTGVYRPVESRTWIVFSFIEVPKKEEKKK